ncbi:uncharacterized protein MYCFIDRAFT_177627 [Pseudocercospora fijiensis CIRAD86]|uniref:Zn(2)-C6 fungal-type domain-containing protein n=1 Tax=Pseudocercospora fijiensis (strain CIRAD86) TaxID=383855 RepID=M3AT87_PSEFD|nr:uncharacterized protein MYCFIDRAFT_177627 [Pseudocercospora fijiensis CIRAD86]EME80692.1 hypothetical protein MYCFIDRAFT_177627 [Pseudocercospora fijiensis CIRAD86]
MSSNIPPTFPAFCLFIHGVFKSQEPPLRALAEWLRAACDFCHTSKIKCSGGKQCSSCSSLNMACSYSYTRHTGRPRGARNRKTLERVQQFQVELDLRSITDGGGAPSIRDMTTSAPELQSRTETSARENGTSSQNESLLHLQSNDPYVGDMLDGQSGGNSAFDDAMDSDLYEVESEFHSDSTLIPGLLSPAVTVTPFQPISKTPSFGTDDVEANLMQSQNEQLLEHEHQTTFEASNPAEPSDISSMDMLTDMSALDPQLPRSNICNCISNLSLGLSRLATSSYMAQTVDTLEDTLSSTRVVLSTTAECFACHCHSAGPRMVVLLLIASSISLIANIISNQCASSGQTAVVVSDTTWPNRVIQHSRSPRRLSESDLVDSSLHKASGISGPKFNRYLPTMREERLMRSALLLNAIDQTCTASRRLLQLANNYRLSLQSGGGLHVDQTSAMLFFSRLPSTMRMSSTGRQSETTMVQGLQYICETMEQIARDMSRHAEDFAIFHRQASKR